MSRRRIIALALAAVGLAAVILIPRLAPSGEAGACADAGGAWDKEAALCRVEE